MGLDGKGVLHTNSPVDLVDLPFSFGFYGEVYSQITINTNRHFSIPHLKIP